MPFNSNAEVTDSPLNNSEIRLPGFSFGGSSPPPGYSLSTNSSQKRTEDPEKEAFEKFINEKSFPSQNEPSILSANDNSFLMDHQFDLQNNSLVSPTVTTSITPSTSQTPYTSPSNSLPRNKVQSASKLEMGNLKL